MALSMVTVGTWAGSAPQVESSPGTQCARRGMQGHHLWATPSTISVFPVILLYLVPARKNFLFLKLKRDESEAKTKNPLKTSL